MMESGKLKKMERLRLLNELLEPIPSAITSLTMTSISSNKEVVKLEEGKEFEDGNGPRTCVCCNLLFKDETKFINHLENEKTHYLALNEREKELTKHNKTPEGKNCDLCDKSFSNIGNLNRHIKNRHHLRSHPFKTRHPRKGKVLTQHNKTLEGKNCDSCDKSFSTTGNLTRHHKIVHEGNKPHKCDICSKTFGRRDAMNSHKTNKHKTPGGSLVKKTN